MKYLIFKIVLPLTIISFAVVNKWWYALPIDGPDNLYYGFPLPFVGAGWHTSMSLQLFIIEFIADFLVYFLFWMLLIYSINRFTFKIKPLKIIRILLLTPAIIITLLSILIAADSNNLFFLKRPYEMEIMDSGYKFIWQEMEYPDYYKYHPERKPISEEQK
jgi:hypothetical protein